MAQTVDLAYAADLAPKDAIEYFRSKGHAISWNWYDTWQEANARAFTVAKVAKLDVLEDIRAAVDSALADGKTFKQFQDELGPTLKKKGWWGRKEVEGPNGLETVQLGSTRRLATIYRVNLQTAYMAGRHKAMVANAANRPYWQYISANDSHVRPDHAAMHGRVFRWDDPIWQHLYPPNGWGCRCRVRALSERQVQARNLRIESGAGKLRTVDKLVSEKTGELQPVTEFAYGSDGRKRLWFSPDVGWSYNPGLAAYQPDLNRYHYATARQYVKGHLTGPAFTTWYRNIEQRVEGQKLSKPDLKIDDLRRGSGGLLQAGGSQPLAVLHPDFQELLGSRSAVVLLSADTLAKQVLHRSGQSIGLEDYYQVQPTLERPDLVVEDRQHHLLFYRKAGGVYMATVKATRDRRELYLQSFRRSNEKQLERAKNKGKVVRDVDGEK